MIPDASFIDEDYANNLAGSYVSFVEAQNKDSDSVEVELPKLTGSTNWVDFRDKFIMKLSLSIGSRGFPLSYVIDPTTRRVTRGNTNLIEVDQLDFEEEDLYSKQPTHFGAYYKRDNAQVWKFLKNHLLGTPVFNHIANCDVSKNGNKAWTLLKNFYEGEDFKTRLKDSAFSKMLQTFYRGDTMRFSFEKYVAVHKSAHKMLEDAGYNNGAGLDESTKCHHFISGIKEQAGLEYAISTARSNPKYQDFTTLISFLSAEVDHRNSRRQQLKIGHNKDRNVSGFVKGGKGKGKQSSNKNSNFPSKVVDGKTVYGKRYSNQEYRKLTSSQKDAVRQLQKDAKRNKQNNNNNRGDLLVKGLTVDDLTVFGDAIVAGIKQAKLDDEDQGGAPDAVTVDSDITSSTKRKAPAGGVGNYISKRRRSANQE